MKGIRRFRGEGHAIGTGGVRVGSADPKSPLSKELRVLRWSDASGLRRQEEGDLKAAIARGDSISVDNNGNTIIILKELLSSRVYIDLETGKFFVFDEINTDIDSGSGARDASDIVADLAAYFAVARKAFEKGVSVAELDEAIDDKLAAKAAARETTGRAKEPPRSDWIEAHKKGVEVPDFIKQAFAAEIADGSMHKGLFSRYKNLRRDFYSYQRSNELPGWLKAVPTEKEWNALHPPKPVPLEELRRVERDAKRARRHQKRALALS